MTSSRYGLLIVIALIGISAAAHNLFDASPESLRKSALLMRSSMDRSDPYEMYGYVTATKLLIQYALQLAEEQPEQALQYKQAIIPLTFNLAADTWTGWEDVHVTAESYRLVGLASARLNLQLRQETSQAPLPRSRGHWIVGAHLIAEGQLGDAAESFANCRDLANAGGDEVVALMATGWIQLTRLLAGGDTSDASEALATIKTKLIAMGKDGPFYAGQFDPALAKFQQ